MLQDNFYVLVVQAFPWAKNIPFIGERGFKIPFENVSKVIVSRTFQLLFFLFLYHKFIEEEVNKIVDHYHMDHEPTNFVESYLLEMQKNEDLE